MFYTLLNESRLELQQSPHQISPLDKCPYSLSFGCPVRFVHGELGARWYESIHSPKHIIALDRTPVR